MQEPEGFHGVNFVQAVEPFYAGTVGDAQQGVEPRRLGVISCAVRSSMVTPSRSQRSTRNGRGAIKLAVSM